MTASVFTEKYIKFRKLLTAYRKYKSITQVELAELLSKPQSYISKYENGERRLDVIEFVEICEALQIDPIDVINQIKKWGVNEYP